MEQPYLSTQLDQLEQRYQAGQEEIGQLQQQLAGQEHQMQEQHHRIGQLEEELAQARQKLAQVTRFDEQVERLKTELEQMIETRLERARPGSPDPGGHLAMQINNHTKALYELQQELEKTRRYEEQIALARTEVNRMNKAIDAFQAQMEALHRHLDDRVPPITHLAEQRRVDARHLAEIQAELPELHKKLEAHLTKIQLVEKQIPQFGKYEVGLEELRNEIRHYREHVDYQIAERERQMKNWADLAQAHEERMAEQKALMEKYAAHYQVNKRALASLQDFQERLQREQHQATELQRLVEERQWAAIQKWQADYEQRWKKQSIEWQPKFEDLQKNIDQLQRELQEILKFNRTVDRELEMVLQILEEDVQARTRSAADWRQRFEEIASGQQE